MNLLKELLRVSDPAIVLESDGPIELADIIKAFPKYHSKAISKLWGGERLTWKGKSFFTGDDWGPAYKEADKAAKREVKNQDTFEENIEISGKTDDKNHRIEVNWDEKIDPSDISEVYVGYNPKNDKLYIGYDAWTESLKFEEAYEKAFEETVGREIDDKNNDDTKLYQSATKKYRAEGYGFWGLIFEVSFNGTSMEADEVISIMNGGFYKTMFKEFKKRNPNVIDIRLD